MKDRQFEETMKMIVDTLRERGYAPYIQLCGYIKENEPMYITSHKNAKEWTNIKKYTRLIGGSGFKIARGGIDGGMRSNRVIDGHCLYPEEIAGLLQLLTQGTAPVNLIEKSLNGESETTGSFEKAYNLKHIQSLDYDEVDEYFSNYQCRFNKTLWIGAQGMI